MSANQFLNALVINDKEGATASFASLLSSKISDTLDVKKVELASSIFDEKTKSLDETEARNRSYSGFPIFKDHVKHVLNGMTQIPRGESGGNEATVRVAKLRAKYGDQYAHEVEQAAQGKYKELGTDMQRHRQMVGFNKEEVEQSLDEAASRKHFQQVADLLKNIPDMDKRKELARHHAGIFKAQNPRFDHNRFYDAAGVQSLALEPRNEDTQDVEVHLHRGAKGTSKFPAENATHARQRAESLAWLHSAKYTQKNNIIHVHADEYYNRTNKKKVAEEVVNEVSKKTRLSAYIGRYSKETRGETSPGIHQSHDTLRLIRVRDGARAMRGAIRRGNVITRSRGFSRGKYAVNELAQPLPTNPQLNRNVLANIRKAVQTLRISGVNPTMAAAGHRDFGKLVANNPKAKGYMLLRKLASNKAAVIQQLTQAGVPLGGALEAHPNDFNQALQRIKRFR